MPVFEPQVRTQLESLLAEGKLAEVLMAVPPAMQVGHFVLLKRRLVQLDDMVTQGTITTEDDIVERNKIAADLLRWIANPEQIDSSPDPVGNKTIDKVTLDLIDNKLRSSLKLYYGLAACLIIIGGGLFAFFFLAGGDTDSVEKIGSGFLTSTSVFPFREIFRRHDRLSVIEILRAQPTLTDRDIEKINSLFLGKNQGSIL